MPKDVTARSWPMRWPAGARWFEPAALDLLKETPIDCLVVPWSAASGAGSLRPFLSEAAKRELALVALADSAAGQAAARAAGFAAVASPEAGSGVIPWMPRAKMPRNSASPVLAVTESVWPSVKGGGEELRAAAREAGPTGVPWVDSNGWFIQMARVLAPDKGIWAVVDPPAKVLTLRGETYALAVADAAAYGGRWVLTLDDEFSTGLAGGDAAAQADWKKVAAALRFFAAHPEWNAYRSIASMGVVSDFEGANEYLSTETLNLVARRHVPYRVIEKSKVGPNSLAGLKVVCYTDEDAPAPALAKALVAFAQAGGLVVVSKKSASLATGPGVTASHGRFEVHTAGKGRIAVSTEPDIDPFMLVGDAHILLSRRQDLMRVWNPGAANSFYAAPAGGAKAVLEILSYTRRPAQDMCVWLSRSWRSARMRTLGAGEPADVKLVPKPPGVEMNLPPFTLFCAIELEA
jgi:hypothetical protein